MRRAILTISTLTAVSFLSPSIATGASAHAFSSDALGYSADLTVETIVRVVSQGRNNMLPFEGTLTAGQIRDLAEYITEVLLSR